MPCFFSAHQRRRDVWRPAAVPILASGRKPHRQAGHTERYRPKIVTRTPCAQGAVHTRAKGTVEFLSRKFPEKQKIEVNLVVMFRAQNGSAYCRNLPMSALF